MRDASDNDASDKARHRKGVRLGPMADSLGFLLRLSQLSAFADFYARFGDLGIRPGELSVLIVIAENPGIRQGVLAKNLMIKRAHMTKMIQAMETAGLVERSVPPDDKRAIDLQLSSAGEAQVKALLAPFLTYESTSNLRLTDAETSQLKRLLRTYLELPEPHGTKDET